MGIFVRYSLGEVAKSHLLVGDVTITENPLNVKVTTSEQLWDDLKEALEGGVITAFVTQVPEEVEKNDSRLYVKDGDGRTRIAEYVLDEPMVSSGIVWLPTITDVISSVHHKNKHGKSDGWRWSKNPLR